MVGQNVQSFWGSIEFIPLHMEGTFDTQDIGKGPVEPISLFLSEYTDKPSVYCARSRLFG